MACQEILRLIHEKVNKPAAPIREPQKFTKEELSSFPADLTDGPPNEEEGNPWDEVDVNEHEGPSVGKAKATHPPPPAKKAAPSAPAPKAALIGAPPQENVEEGTIKTRHAKGHVRQPFNIWCCLPAGLVLLGLEQSQQIPIAPFFHVVLQGQSQFPYTKGGIRRNPSVDHHGNAATPRSHTA